MSDFKTDTNAFSEKSNAGTREPAPDLINPREALTEVSATRKALKQLSRARKKERSLARAKASDFLEKFHDDWAATSSILSILMQRIEKLENLFADMCEANNEKNEKLEKAAKSASTTGNKNLQEKSGRYINFNNFNNCNNSAPHHNNMGAAPKEWTIVSRKNNSPTFNKEKKLSNQLISQEKNLIIKKFGGNKQKHTGRDSNTTTRSNSNKISKEANNKASNKKPSSKKPDSTKPDSKKINSPKKDRRKPLTKEERANALGNPNFLLNRRVSYTMLKIINTPYIRIGEMKKIIFEELGIKYSMFGALEFSTDERCWFFAARTDEIARLDLLNHRVIRSVSLAEIKNNYNLISRMWSRAEQTGRRKNVPLYFVLKNLYTTLTDKRQRANNSKLPKTGLENDVTLQEQNMNMPNTNDEGQNLTMQHHIMNSINTNGEETNLESNMNPSNFNRERQDNGGLPNEFV
ncbi:hypothetical protein NUSPORA_02096 [Nucleospora cyclopteri]